MNSVQDTESPRLDRSFFNRPTLQVARDLLGKFIVRSSKNGRLSAMIAEVEAYRGPRDLACHAAGGRRTPRVEPLYRDGGTVYVYLVYGVHWLLNFSTAGEGRPEGALIRGVIGGLDGNERLISGPGRVTQHLGIDKRHDGLDATRSSEIWLEDRGVKIPPRRILRGPRVGVDYAGPYWASRPWRFIFDGGLGVASSKTAINRKNRVGATASP